jgi:hypothetical protein
MERMMHGWWAREQRYLGWREREGGWWYSK